MGAVTVPQRTSIEQLFSALQEARQRTLELVDDLSDEQMIGPRLAIVNPLRWELGHLAWFQEFWVLRHFRQQAPALSEGDTLYDSARVAHDTRWDLPLPSKAQTLEYLRQILDRILNHQHVGTADGAHPRNGYDETYFLYLALFHEYMHAEAVAYTRQTLSYAAPRLAAAGMATRTGAPDQPATHRSEVEQSRRRLGDARIPGGIFSLGSTRAEPFVFDNEQWAHPVELKPYSIARTAVTNAEFAAFVNDGGYRRREFWTEDGWQWRGSANAEHPVYWRRDSGARWLRRNFDAMVPLEGHLPILHVNWYEATAFCHWARRRLPTEAEWEMAACAEPASGSNGISERKRKFPWGDDPATPERANLDWRAMGCVDVNALPAGDSAFGCRQMIGNVWEWTATDFQAYPGFLPGPYKEYSAPWFGTHKVLRGGCWVTRSRLITNTYRNFYTPDRRDVWAGFRTCAL